MHTVPSGKCRIVGLIVRCCRLRRFSFGSATTSVLLSKCEVSTEPAVFILYSTHGQQSTQTHTHKHINTTINTQNTNKR